MYPSKPEYLEAQYQCYCIITGDVFLLFSRPHEKNYTTNYLAVLKTTQGRVQDVEKTVC